MASEKEYKCSYPKDKFNEIQEYLVTHKKNFVLVNSGSTKKIIYGRYTYSCVDTDKIAGSGFHLSPMVKKEIDAYILAHQGEQIGNNKPYKEQLFNLKGLQANIGRVGFAIDINDCYWRTLYKLGYISQKLYLYGLRKKEWKMGRNATIGGLIKQEITMPYVNGKENRIDRVKTPINKDYYAIRNHVISHVYDMFMELYKLIGDDFCMFLTDCIFTVPNRYKIIKSFFDSKGYKVKVKEVEFVKLDDDTNTIHWYEASEKGKPIKKRGEIVDYRTGMKYYQFSDNQVL